MIKVQSIWLLRAEGNLAGKQHTVASFDEANEILRGWAWTAPNLGYEKIYFTVTYEDGISYHGRYDLHYAELADLSKHMRSFLRFHTGDHCPSWLTNEEYRAALPDEAFCQSCRDFLATREV